MAGKVGDELAARVADYRWRGADNKYSVEEIQTGIRSRISHGMTIRIRTRPRHQAGARSDFTIRIRIPPFDLFCEERGGGGKTRQDDAREARCPQV